MCAIKDEIKPPALEDINAVINGETPLIVAARLNRLEVLTLLLKAPDIQVDLMDAKGWFDSLSTLWGNCLFLYSGVDNNLMCPLHLFDVFNISIYVCMYVLCTRPTARRL